MSDHLDKILLEVKNFANSSRESADKAELFKNESAKNSKYIEDFVKSLAVLATDAKKEDEETEKKGKHLNSYLDDFYFFTGEASKINRSIALAGIAVIWLFKTSENATSILPRLPKELYLPLLILILSLVLDLLQYVVGSLFWGIFYRVNLFRWKKSKIDSQKVKDLESPNILSYTITSIFYLKIVAMILAYIFLLLFIKDKISWF